MASTSARRSRASGSRANRRDRPMCPCPAAAAQAAVPASMPSARSTPAAGVVVRGGLGRDQVAAFQWSVAVGDGDDAVLDEEEIAALVEAKAPLVRLRARRRCPMRR